MRQDQMRQDQDIAIPDDPPPPAVNRGASPPAAGEPSPSALHSGMSLGRYYGLHVQGAVFPLTAGVLLYGWRAILVIFGVLASVALGVGLWRRVGTRGRQLRYSHALWLGLLTALALPGHLAGGGSTPPAGIGAILWPVIPGAGLLLVIMLWLLGGAGSGRVHPVVATLLLLIVLFGGELVPHYVLQRSRLLRGDLLQAPTPAVGAERSTAQANSTIPWSRRPPVRDFDATRGEPASEELTRFTAARPSSEHGWVSLESLLRDRMPPLEDLIIGGSPAPLGLGSAIAVIVGGLLLLYRGLIDSRIPLAIVLMAFATFIIAPVPVVVTESAIQWRWMAGLRGAQVGWPTAITFADYELMAGPLLFTAFFLATGSAVRPMGRRARWVYGAVVGVLAAAGQLYVSASYGAYLGLLIGAGLTPTLDRRARVRPLI